MIAHYNTCPMLCVQVAALQMKNKKGIRWHPLLPCWCLNISRISPKAFEVMPESGISLPTRRTLNDYTHWMAMKPGFQHEIDRFLMSEAKVNDLKDWERWVSCFTSIIMSLT